MRYYTMVEEKEYIIDILEDGQLILDGQALQADLVKISGQPIYSLLLNDKLYESYIYENQGDWQVFLNGHGYKVQVLDEREKALQEAMNNKIEQRFEFNLRAPMPGMVISIHVQEGQAVKKGDVLILLESMKMQNELKSPKDGVVTHLRIQAGERVEQKQVLLSVI